MLSVIHIFKMMWTARYFNIVSSLCFPAESEITSLHKKFKTQENILNMSYLFQHVLKFHTGYIFDRNGWV